MKIGIYKPALEIGFIAILLEQLGIGLHQADDEARLRLVVLDGPRGHPENPARRGGVQAWASGDLRGRHWLLGEFGEEP